MVIHHMKIEIILCALAPHGAAAFLFFLVLSPVHTPVKYISRLCDDLLVKHTAAHQLLTNQERQYNGNTGGDRRTARKAGKRGHQMEP